MLPTFIQTLMRIFATLTYLRTECSKWPLLAACMMMAGNAWGQDFVDVTLTAFPSHQAVIESAASWGDIDNDGDMDLIVAGEVSLGNPQTILYRNNGGVFTPETNLFVNVWKAAVALGDYNNDGFLDVLLCGQTQSGAPISNLYTNNGGSSFTLNSTASSTFTDVLGAAAEWADYDNDGDLDLLITGDALAGESTKLYQNNNGIFVEETAISSLLEDVEFGDVAFGDYDNDGHIDLVIQGLSQKAQPGVSIIDPFTGLYHNNGQGGFDPPTFPFTFVQEGSLDWGDYDNDGLLDLLLTGVYQLDTITKVYHNNGGGDFNDMGDPFFGIMKGQASWGDYDNDGWLDILLVGEDDKGMVAKVFHNETASIGGQGGFSETLLNSALLTPKDLGATAIWGDYNGDQKLDILTVGRIDTLLTARALHLYENINLSPNTTPPAPVNLTAVQIFDEVHLSWDPPPGFAGDADGLSYNIYIGTAPLQIDVASPMSDLFSGKRRLVKLGNVSHGTNWVVRELAGGTYYWNVQAIDADFEGSAWNNEESFVFVPPMPTFQNVSSTAFPSNFSGRINGGADWGDYDNDGDLDLVVTGEVSPFNYKTTIYKNVGGVFVEDAAASTPLVNVSLSDVAWGDFDNDGSLDLVVCGQDASGNTHSNVYMNNGSGLFTLSNVASSGLNDVLGASIDCGDYNNDGFLDLVISGNANGSPSTTVYRNNGIGGFDEDMAASGSLMDVAFGDVAWGDYDNDGDLDLLLIGDTPGGSFSAVFRQDNGVFTDIMAFLTDLQQGSVDWGDFNNDGFLDILMVGEQNNGAPLSKVYQNNGAGGFFDKGVNLADVENGQASWADYNNDGFLDILLAGEISGAGRITRLYLNQAGNNFVEDFDNLGILTAVNGNAAAIWGDYNADGLIDFFLMGQGDGGKVFQLFKNIDNSPAAVPLAPVNLQANQVGDEVQLSWDAPPGVAAGLVNGLTYNLYISKTTPGPVGDASPKVPMAFVPGGGRKVAAKGNVQHVKTWTVNSLEGGDYVWSVQAIDPDFQGSIFAPQQTFSFVAPDFLDQTGAVFAGVPTGVEDGEVAWVDYDNDGDLDLWVTGNSASGFVAQLYKNNGGTFSLDGTASAGLPGVWKSASAWTDYDHDGWLDVIITGESSAGAVSKLFRNNGLGGFAEAAQFTFVQDGSVAWADFNNDGFPDLALSGQSGSGPITKLYRNEGDGTFLDLGLAFANVQGSSLAWADYNNDGFPDLLVAGNTGTGLQTTLYENDGTGGFVPVPAANFTGMEHGSLAWADYNHDGFLDVLLSGMSAAGPVSQVYFNDNGTGTFNNIGAPLLPVANGQAVWGDYNNDSFVDILLIGESTAGATDIGVKLYQNNGGFSFTEDDINSAAFEAAGQGSSLAWGDYNKDGKLDVALAGRTSNTPLLRKLLVYENQEASPIIPLNAPTNLSMTQVNNEVILSWDPPAGYTGSAAQALTYQVYVGTSSGGTEIASPQSAIPGGFRRLATLGRTHQASWRLNGLTIGNYFWSVQAIDASYKGSPFAAEETFSFVPPGAAFIDATTNFPAVPNGLDQAFLSWGDYDGDNDLDLLAIGQDLVGFSTTSIYENTNAGLIKDVAASNTLPQISRGQAAWGDYDHDGDLDLVLAGAASGGGSITALYLNNGNGIFSVGTITAAGLQDACVATADYDNDGDLDVFVSGMGNASRLSFLFNNQGNATFVNSGLSFAALDHSSAAWADYNLDTYPDLLLTGESATGPLTKLYTNNGDGTFTDTPHSMTDAGHGSVDWGDYDNDGDPDILLTGASPAGPVSKVYKNNNGIFAEDPGAVLTGVQEGMAAWGDYDDDGLLDIVLMGGTAPVPATNRTTKLYQNNNGNFFAEDALNSSILTDVNQGCAFAWGDYDKDDKLDLVLTGRSADSPAANRLLLFHNINTNPPSTPGAPQGLSSTQVGDEVILSWAPNANYPANLAPGLSYQLYVGSSFGAIDVVAPMANLSSGYRRVVQEGMVLGTSWTLKNLSIGTYFWNVQAIDAGYEASAFSAVGGSFTFIPSGADFIDVTNDTTFAAGLPEGLINADLAWGDYDNDGDLDLLAAGHNSAGVYTTDIYRNDGGSLQRDVLASTPLIGVGLGEVSWGDYDRDGFLDILLAGMSTTGRTAKVYRNTGSGSFADINVALPQVAHASVAWGDYDNDGDLDILLTGEQVGAIPVTKVFQNDNGTFADPGFSFTAVQNGDARWGDYDRDGDLDILLCGQSATGAVAQIYQNQLNGDSFTLLSTSLLPLAQSKAAWGDYNNDGYLDIAMMGADPILPPGANAIVALYTYNPNTGNFEIAASNPAGMKDGQLAWGDFDDDGFLDLAICGQINALSNDRATRIYHNQTGNGLVLDTLNSAILADVNQGSALAWADYDKDGKLDLAVAGMGNNNHSLKLYRNIDTNPNQTPSAPQIVSAIQNGDEVQLSWLPPPGHAQDLADGLSYNLYIRSSHADATIKPAMAEVPGGFRRVVRLGNTHHSTSWSVKSLSAGTYFWSVQAIDQDFEGSSFAQEATFDYIPPGASFINTTSTNFPGLPPGLNEATLEWGDYDNDNDLDVLVCGKTADGAPQTRLYENNGGIFAELVSILPIFADVANGSAKWGDYDRDGWLDLLLTGATQSGKVSLIYRNTGGGGFEEIDPGLPPVDQSSVAWGDYDNDGDLDILLMGLTPASGPVSKVFRNDGQNVFTDINAPLPNLYDGSLAWGDYDADGDLDILITGETNASGPLSKVYENNGGSFTDMGASLQHVSSSSVAWADFNNDGFLDILLTGDSSPSIFGFSPVARVYYFLPATGNFEDINALLTPVRNGSAVVGDYNDDGWADIVLSGKDGPGVTQRSTLVYANNGGAGFAEDLVNSAILTNVDEGSALAFGDFNQDGKLDLLLSGRNSNTPLSNVFELYQNINANPNLTALAPANLQATQLGNSITFSWTPPPNYAAPLQKGLSYNLYLGTQVNGVDLRSPMASIPGGYRRVVRLGDIQSTSITLTNLPTTTLYWSVQAIEADFEGSPFAQEQSLTIDAPDFVDVSDTVLTSLPAGFTQTAMAWADINKDGALDVALTGKTPSGPFTMVYQQQAGILTPLPISLPNVQDGSLDWGDFNQDGFADLLLTGETTTGPVSKILVNNQNGGFVDVAPGLPGMYQSDAIWIDVNHDGRQDVLMSGRANSGRSTRLFINTGLGGLQEMDIDLFDASFSSLAAADFDLDGDVDVLISGEIATGLYRTGLFLNDGSGNFVESNQTFTGFGQGSLAWGDYDNNGLLDILMTGNTLLGPATKIYQQQSDHTFTEIFTTLPGIAQGQAVWGDYNDDGLLDIALSGSNASGNRITALYRYTGASFDEDLLNSPVLADVGLGSSLAWGDYNHDGKLDLLLGGSSADQPNGILKLYKNRHPAQNVLPPPPENLRSAQLGQQIRLRWDAPSGFDPARLGGLSYNLYVGTLANRGDKLSPLADEITGYRHIVHLGNASQNRQFLMSGLPPGTYFWSVQSIDADFEGSPFAPEDTFSVAAPTFEDVTTSAFPSLPAGMDLADFDWGDFDQDGDLDLLLMGQNDLLPYYTTLFENTGGAFVENNTLGGNFEDFRSGSARWGDADNDGDLDVLLAGETAFGYFTLVYEYDNGAFTQQAILQSLKEPRASWIDYDHDGLLDIFLMGEDPSIGTPMSRLYRNQGNFTFEVQTTAIANIKSGYAAWGDYNRDGYADLLISGQGSTGNRSFLYKNQGDGTFVESGISLPALLVGSIDWGDFNNDGWPDILMTGNNSGIPFTEVFLNNGDETFQNITAGLPQLLRGHAAWGDYNDDGFTDIIISGKTGPNATDRLTALYRNVDGAGFEQDVINSPILTDVDNGNVVKWGDYDNDGKLDLFILGRTSASPTQRVLKLFQNLDPNPNRPVPEPVLQQATQLGDKMRLIWSIPPGQNADLINGLSYNVVVSRSPNAFELVAPMAHIPTGYRQVVSNGNAHQSLRFDLSGLEAGTYYWSVQAIDVDHEGSPFPEFMPFTYIPPGAVFIDESGGVLPPVVHGLYDADLAWGDYDNDGDLDFVASGNAGGSNSYSTRLYRNDDGRFNLDIIASDSLVDVNLSSLAWGDYDNDGDLDLLLSGETPSGPETRIYTNKGNSTFTSLRFNIEEVSNGHVSWADYNNDGHLDFIITGIANIQNSSVPRSRLFRNDGSGNFELEFNASFVNVSASSTAWADYDQDGDMDVIIIGEAQGGGPETKLYRNEGQGNFTALDAGLEDVAGGSVAWGDIDNDGFPDLLLTGHNGSSAVTQLYRNQGDGSFLPLPGPAGVYEGEAAFGDYDDDGWIDLVVTGRMGISPASRSTRLYHNEQGVFVESSINSDILQDLAGGSALAWGDYNDDGKLDLLMAGRATPGGNGMLKIYRNIDSNPNRQPAVPVGLRIDQVGDEIVFRWDPPPSDRYPAQIVKGLSYNIYVGTASRQTEVWSPMANPVSGKRQLVARGNAGQANSWRMKGLGRGTYYWSVQSIEGDFEGSAFPEAQFEYIPPDFTNVTTAQNPNSPPTPLLDGDIAWADYDGDGSLDFVSTGRTLQGEYLVEAYKNIFGVSFIPDQGAVASVKAVADGALAWGDYNNDNSPDLMVTGYSAEGPVSILYKNDGNRLQGLELGVLVPLGHSSVAWGDYDNDGWQDLAMMGEPQPGNDPVTYVYRNLGRELQGNQGDTVVFERMNFGLQGLRKGDLAWGDYDKDGDLDLLISGESASGAFVSRLYRNDGSDGLVDAQIELEGLGLSSVDWGDYDNDGDLDILMAGTNGNQTRTIVVENNGAFGFSSNNGFNIEGIQNGSAEWGDYNDDGFLDILLTGSTGSGFNDRVTSIYQNFAGRGFVISPINSDFLPDLDGGAVARWADFTGDGKLDFVLMGRTGLFPPSAIFRLYRNDERTTNLQANAPVRLFAEQVGDQITFKWGPPPGYGALLTPGLSYNLYLGTNSMIGNLNSPLSGIPQGRRKVVKFGGIKDTTWTLKNLPSGDYFWSVQAIEADYEGSPFAQEEGIMFLPPSFVDVTDTSFLQNRIPRLANATVDWGDYDRDGRLDFAVAGDSAGILIARIYRQSQEGFERIWDLQPVKNGDLAWGDYDNDGDLDLVLTGMSFGDIPQTLIYENTGIPVAPFTIPGNIGDLVNVGHSSVDWGDYDNDGDLDLLITGQSPTIGVSKIYQNSGGNTFFDIGAGLPGVVNGDAKWGDMDNDGDLDVVLTGSGITRLFINEGENIFAPSTLPPLLPLSESTADWGDYDNDGLADLLLTGSLGDSAVAQVYKNLGGGLFVPLTDSIKGVRNGSGQWGDYNNDGFRDILLTGKNGNNVQDRASLLYRNDRNGHFIADTINSDFVINVNGGSQALWGDFNNDLKLDFILVGRVQSSPDLNTLRLYKNVGNIPIREPQPPVAPMPIVEEDRVILSWTPPSGYDQTQQDGLTFNLFVEKAPPNGQDLKLTPMANIDNGQRRVIRLGNAGHTTTWAIFGLEEGDYYFGVQTIEQSFNASKFVRSGLFHYTEPTFSDQTSAALPTIPFRGLDHASIDWGDYDNDGDLDVVLTGETDAGPLTRVLINENGVLQPAPFNFIDVKNGCAKWGDYNRDGFLDILLTGESISGPIITIYRNIGGADFRNVGGFIEGARQSYADWGDYDNDGDQDLLIIGEFNTQPPLPITRIYVNDSARAAPSFSASAFGTNFPNIKDGMVDWGDYDGDGDLDVLMTGFTGSIPITKIFRRDLVQSPGQPDSIKFVDVTGPGITGVMGGSASWGDFNNDGLLDFVISGNKSQNGGMEPVTEVYQNMGGDRFVKETSPILQVAEGEARWGDYNDDGFADLAIAGQAGPNDEDHAARIYRNVPGPDGRSFQIDELAGVFVRGVENGGALAWADYDNDLKLDLMLAGRSRAGRRSLRLYHNNEGSENRTPLPPMNLDASFSFTFTGARFRWEPPVGYPDSLLKGLSYNIYVWKEESTGYTVPAAADSASGYRRLVGVGNMGPATFWNLDLKREGEGTYLWSVQSIDADFEGSDFAEERAFFYKPEGFVDITPDLFPDSAVGVNSATIAWGDYDNDGDLDILSAGEVTEDTFLTAIYRNDYNSITGETRFFLDTLASNPLRDVRWSSLDWGDYDRDDDLDILLCGQDTSGNRIAHIYRNVKSGNRNTFVLDSLASQNLIPVWKASAAWADYDNDGDLDILITGNSANGPKTTAYRNNGDGTFDIDPLESGNALVDVESGSIDWGDFNRDSYPDLIITGQSEGATVGRVYENNKNGGFIDITLANRASITAVKEGSVAWGDCNNDGYLDLIITGERGGSGLPVTEIYKYFPDEGIFDDIATPEITKVKLGSVDWGDYDGDGDLDILITGQDTDTTRISKVYRNDRVNERFAEDINASGALENVDLGASAWGDFDADGRLDILLAGRTSEQPITRTFKVYRNVDDEIPTNKPDPPRNLRINTDQRDRVILEWDPPVIDTTGFPPALSYNVSVLALDSGRFHLSPMSDTLNGYRRIVENGNAGHANHFELRFLPSGNYCWAVQAIDADFQGSDFITFHQCFDYESPKPLIIDSLFAKLYIKDSAGISSWIQLRDTSLLTHGEFWYRGIAEDGNFRKIIIDKTSDTIRMDFTNQLVIESATPVSEDGDEIGLEYYFKAVGRYGQDAQTPLIHMYIRYPDGIDLDRSNASFIMNTFGVDEKAFRIMAIPLKLENDSIQRVIGDELGEYNEFRWKFGHYQSGGLMSGQTLEYTKDLYTIEPGKGYWIIMHEEMRNAISEFNTGDGTTVKVSKERPFTIDLEPGWNQIGNPYEFNLLWESIWEESETDLQYCIYEDRFQGERDGILLLRKYEGAFVFAPEAQQMRIPVIKNQAINRQAPVVLPKSSAINAPDWEVNLLLESGDLQYTQGGIGMSTRASESFDRLDIMRPPRPARYLDLTAYHWEYELWPMFSTDIVPYNDHHIWDFEVEKNSEREEVSLRWDNGGMGFGRLRLFLLDLERDIVVDMQAVDHYDFRMLTHSHRLRIYYGDEAFIKAHLKPERVRLGLPYPNPFSQQITIPLSLPQYVNQQYIRTFKVEMLLFNAIGQQVKKLYEGELESGFHEFVWDGRNDEGLPLPEGVYIYQLRVETPQGPYFESKRILLER